MAEVGKNRCVIDDNLAAAVSGGYGMEDLHQDDIGVYYIDPNGNKVYLTPKEISDIMPEAGKTSIDNPLDL